MGREEFFCINLAIKQLTQKHPLVLARFWGKVFGTRANYIVAEAEFQEGEGEDEEEDDMERERPENEGDGTTDGGDMDEDGSDTERDEPPKSQWKPPPTVPKEDPKTGVNKKTYFVCNTRKWGNNPISLRNVR